MTFHRREPFSSPLLPFLALVLALSAAPASAETCNNVCDFTYALCIAATCTDNGDGTAECDCTVIDGLSVGPKECPDVDGLVSRFSTALYDSKPFYNGSGPSTDCYGKPCTATGDGGALCTCHVNDDPDASWWSEAACSAAPSGTLYSAASSPFEGGGLAGLAELIAECSSTTAPTPQACDGD